MAKYVQPNPMSCQHCGNPFSVEEWYDDISYMDRGNIRAPRRRIVPSCSCPYPVALNNPNIKAVPSTKEAPVTAKQYSTEPLKDDALKAVSSAFKDVELQLLNNALALKELSVSNDKMLAAELKELDRALLRAGQSGVLFDELNEAFPADGNVLTTRLEAVWATVSFDNLENAS
jgi:hypothetical protein